MTSIQPNLGYADKEPDLLDLTIGREFQIQIKMSILLAGKEMYEMLGGVESKEGRTVERDDSFA